MTFEQYKEYLQRYAKEVEKVILLGGEPTIHPQLERMLDLNREFNLRTTIYSNGFDLKKLESVDMTDVSLRVGVYGNNGSEKPLSRVYRTSLETDIVYMLRKDNVEELLETAKVAETEFNCRGFYISSIRDIAVTQSFWKDSDETLPLGDYCKVVQNFVNNFDVKIKKLHLARRGLLYTGNEKNQTECCRFGNIFPDGEKIICPLDISRKIKADELVFNKRKCNKDDFCVLQKIVLEYRA
jgi:MoaA/NifB/PqqE/SkfB family radical SAM enzyme